MSASRGSRRTGAPTGDAPAGTDRTGDDPTGDDPTGTDPGPDPIEAGPADAPASPGARRRLRRPQGRPSWAVVGAALGLAVVCLGAVLALAFARPAVDDELRESALVAARTYTMSLTTYDHRTLDEDVARVQRAATGAFAQEYDETIAQLRDQLVSTQAVSTGTVVGAGIESLQEDSATVLVAVDQTLMTAEMPEPRSETNRLRMVLVRRDGSWRVEQVERL